MSSAKTKLLAIYSVGKGITGQVAATLMLIDILKGQGWQVNPVKLPALDRNQHSRYGAILVYLVRLAGAWLSAPRYLFSRPDYVYLNIGQTVVALLRDWVPFKLLSTFTGAKGVVSMHGSVFMSWEKGAFAARLFRSVLRSASAVTVLGARQKAKLVALGVPEEKVFILPNTCDLEAVTQDELSAKQAAAAPLRYLFLSNLIDSKGYPEFLEAMEKLAQHCTRPVEVILCGKLHQSDFGARFASVDEAETWIEERLKGICRNEAFKARWLRGAYGADKQIIFRQAHVFVFPSQYAVEAQPIVLLEAMASGAAVITTSVGEVPETVAGAAVVLPDADPANLAEEAATLLEQPDLRLSYAQKGLALFHERYSKPRHADLWQHLFQTIGRPGSSS